MNTLTIRIFLLIVSIAFPLHDSLGSRVSVKFSIMDSEQRPVPNAEIQASLPGPGNAVAKTDNAGQATLSLDETHNLTVDVSHPDYYSTNGELWRGGQFLTENGSLANRKLPRQFEIVIKKIKNPVPLVRRTYRGHVPPVKGSVGFDLSKNDWTAPYGSGYHTDLIFSFSDVSVGDDNFSATLLLSFPNETDGIKPFHAARPYSMEFGSNLAPPHRAPVSGYSPNLKKSIRFQRGDSLETLPGDNRSFLFRVRSKADASGTLLKACYGWIQGEIEFDPRDPAGMQLYFTYEFNPDPDPDARSLEPIRN